MWFRRSSHSCPASAPRANCPRRSKATTPDSLWASGRRAPEPGCARSEATRATPATARCRINQTAARKRAGGGPFLFFPTPDARHEAGDKRNVSQFSPQQTGSGFWANCPRRSEATTPDSLWASGRGAPKPGCTRSEATTAARQRRPAAYISTNSGHRKRPPEGGPVLDFPDA